MRFEKIAIDGFGKLVDQKFTFSPGLNVIVGPNEAGKSTLQLALLYLLYGIFPEGSVKAEMRGMRDALKPWTGTAGFGGELVYSLQDGSEYRVLRTFGPRGMATTLMSLPEGQDISGQFQAASSGRLYFAERQLGVSRDVFEQTCFVRQSELLVLERSVGAITERLMQISASAASDTTALEALAALQAASREEVGTDRSWTKPLAQARKVVDDLQKERARAVKAHEALLALYADRWERLQALGRAQRNRDRLRYLSLSARLIEVRRQHAQLVDIGREVRRWTEETERLSEWAEFPIAMRDQVVMLEARLRDLRQSAAGLCEEGMNARQETALLETQRSALEAEASSFADVRALDTAALATINDLWSRRTLLMESVAKIEQVLAGVEREIAEMQSSVEARKSQLAPALRLGVSGVASMRHRLESVVQREAAAEQALREAEEKWRALTRQTDIPVWATYPGYRIDDVNATLRRLTDQAEALEASKRAAVDAAAALGHLDNERAALDRRTVAAQFPRDIEDSITQAQTLVAEWGTRLDRQEMLEQQWQRAQLRLTDNNLEVGRDQTEPHPALDLGLGGVASLRQRWSDVTQRLSMAEEQRSQAEAEWLLVGMDETRFQTIERSVEAYLTGKAPAPAARRGCLGIFGRGKPSDQPTAIKIYRDILPIHTRLRDAQSAEEAAQQEREQVLREIHAALGPQAGDRPTDVLLAALQERIESDLVSRRTADAQQRSYEVLANEMRRARDATTAAQERATSALGYLGIVANDPASAISELATLSKAHTQNRNDEARLRELQLQAENLQRDVATHRRAATSYNQARDDLNEILRAAHCEADSIDVGIDAFRVGVLAQERWKEYKTAHAESLAARQEAEETLGAPLGGDLSDEAFEQMQSAMDGLASDEATLGAREATLEDLQKQCANGKADVAGVENQLQAALRGAGVMEPDLAHGVDTYRNRYERRRRLAAIERDLEELRHREHALRRDINDYEGALTALANVESELRAILHESGIEAQDVLNGVAEFHRSAGLHVQWRDAAEKRDQAKQLYAVNLAAGREIDFEILSQEIESEWSAMMTMHPEWADLPVNDAYDVYEEQTRATDGELGVIERRVGDIDRDMQRLIQDHRDLAAIDEDLAIAEGKVCDLERLRAGLDAAHTRLETAMHAFQKQFAPQLQLWMAEGLERITQGRYRDVTIDPVTLAVSVKTPEIRSTIPVDQLSSGTRDAAYLTLRVAIARFMSRSGEPLPLLLDDPFVRLDEQRMDWALRYLQTLAEDTQILLFSKDDQIATWYEELAGAQHRQIHRLPRPLIAV